MRDSVSLKHIFWGRTLTLTLGILLPKPALWIWSLAYCRVQSSVPYSFFQICFGKIKRGDRILSTGLWKIHFLVLHQSKLKQVEKGRQAIGKDVFKWQGLLFTIYFCPFFFKVVLFVSKFTDFRWSQKWMYRSKTNLYSPFLTNFYVFVEYIFGFK